VVWKVGKWGANIGSGLESGGDFMADRKVEGLVFKTDKQKQNVWPSNFENGWEGMYPSCLRVLPLAI
jgi:hypothetical protein